MLKVFLVDDEYFERNALKVSIPWKDNGFKVIGEANNGKSAYQEITEKYPDIAVIDINMPGYNGLELIQKLCEAQINCRYIILTGYDEFKYAQKALKLGVYDYILKPINYDLFLQSLNDLKFDIQEQQSFSSRMQTLERQNNQLFLEHYYNDLVNCNFTASSLSQYDGILAQNLLLSYPAYGIFVLEFPDTPSISQLREFQSSITNNFIKEPFVCCIDIKNRLFFIMDASDQTHFSEFIDKILQFTKDAGLAAICGIGKIYSNFEQLYLSYNEACIALQNYSVFKKELIRYSELSSSSAFHGLDFKIKNQVKALILNQSTQQLNSFLMAIYEQFSFQKMTYDSIIFQTLELLMLLTEMLSSQTAMPISVLNANGSILDTLYKMREVKDIRDWIIQLYTVSIETVLKKPQNASDTTVCVENYILQNAGNPELSISMISADLYLNYSYICYCFKRDKGMTINDFINRIRIEKALEMFCNGITNVSFVAEKSGFNNAGYFSKKFKKATGLSPSEYIKIPL